MLLFATDCHDGDNTAAFKQDRNLLFLKHKYFVDLNDIGGIVRLVMEFVSVGNDEQS